MRKKILFTSIVFCLIYMESSFSQCVSIELSAKWEKGFDIFRKDSSVCFPLLSITYRNNSNVNLYFPKVSYSRYGYPMLYKGTLIQYPIEEYLQPNYLKRAKFHGNYSNTKYKVLIGGNPLFLKGWVIENDTMKSGVEYEIDMINNDLADIYEYIYRNDWNFNTDSIDWTKFYFSETDVTSSGILNEVKDKFVFLKAGEVYTDTYNLIGFQVIKGCFTFCIEPNILKEYVNTAPIWDTNQSKYIEIKAPLPIQVGEYELYSGKFSSNIITIDFNER